MKRLIFVMLAGLLAVPAMAQDAPARHKRLADVQEDLHLTPTQLPLWQDFTVALRAAGKARHDAYLQAQAAPPDLPSRLAQYKAMLAVQQKSVEDEQKALSALWGALSDQQKSLMNDEVTLTPVRKRAAKAAAK